MSDKKDEQAFEDYLKGNSALSRCYRSEAMEEPPAQLDDKIIAAAKKSTINKALGAGISGPRWYVPLSLAAVVVISFSVVFRIYDKETLPNSNKYPETKIENQDTLEDMRIDQFSGKSESVLKDEVGEIREKSDSKTQVLKREMAAPTGHALEEDIGQSNGISEQGVQGRSSSQLSADKPAKILMREQTMEMPSEEEFRKEQAPQSAKSGITNTLNPEQRFELINQYWIDGDKQAAYEELKNFIQAYPDYPAEELKDRLPEGMDFEENYN